MCRFIQLLLLGLTVWSCSNQSTPVIKDLDLPYSVKDELTSTHITGQVFNYDSTAHPGFIGLTWQTWHGTSLDKENYFLEPDGSFAFTVRDNVVRDYNLSYNNQFYEFAVIPGSDPYLELIPEAGKFTFAAPRDSFVENSNYLIAALTNEAYWERGRQIFNFQTDLDSMQQDALNLEKDMRQRFDTLWREEGHTDPVLHEFVNQFIDHRTRRTFPFRVWELSKESERQANNEKFLYPDLGRELPDMPVYCMMNVDRIQNEMALLLDLQKSRVMSYPKAKRKDAGFELYLSLIDSLYTGFSRDIVRVSTLIRYLGLEKPPATARQLAAEMVQICPYPSLREPLEERLRILNQSISPMDDYEQSLLDIPEGMDNPIPAILAEHAGKVIVLDFWATWCSPCISEMKDHYPAFMKKYDPEQFVVVFLAQSSPENLWRDQISKLEFSAVHLRTNKEQTSVVSKLFGISGIPHHAVFDQQGTLVKAKTDGPGYGLADEVDRLLGL